MFASLLPPVRFPRALPAENAAIAAPAGASPARGRTAWPDGRRTWLFVVLAVVMTALKLYCAATTIGTNDVRTFQVFARTLETADIVALYHHSVYFNHTPLVAAYIGLIDAGHPSLRTFAFFLRLPGILADLAVVFLLVGQRRRLLMATCPDWALALFIASPVSFMVSGYHGNFDPVMVMFLVFAAWLCVVEQIEAAALVFALSMQVKVATMIVLPVFFVFALRRGKAGRFAAVFLLTCAAGWYEPLARDPRVFFRNVFDYSSFWGFWGVTYWLERTALPVFALGPLDDVNTAKYLIVKGLKAGIMLGIIALAWTRRPFTADRLVPTLAVAWSLFFVFAPGGCPQYLVWPAPFVLLFHARWYAGLTAGSTLFCFFFYQTLNGTMPWDFGRFRNADIPLWTPWMLLAWTGTGGGLFLWWKHRRLDPAGAASGAPD